MLCIPRHSADKGLGSRHVREQAPHRNLLIVIVDVQKEPGLSYLVPRELLYSGIHASKEPCVSDLVELLRHVRHYSRVLEKEQHITPHVIIRIWHALTVHLAVASKKPLYVSKRSSFGWSRNRSLMHSSPPLATPESVRPVVGPPVAPRLVQRDTYETFVGSYPSTKHLHTWSSLPSLGPFSLVSPPIRLNVPVSSRHARAVGHDECGVLP